MRQHRRRLAALLRPGNAGSNTAADHITVTDLALAQIPDAHRHGTPILVCADGAGATKPCWLICAGSATNSTWTCGSRSGFTMTATVQQAILALPKQAWTAATETGGELREGADVAELTGALGDLTAAGWPTGMRVLVRRERPHPGAQLTFSDVDGWRFQTFATDTEVGQLAHFEARHRAHARVRGPDPLRQEHRPCPPAVPAAQRQHRLGRARRPRLRPARLDPHVAP